VFAKFAKDDATDAQILIGKEFDVKTGAEDESDYALRRDILR
jgi:hypothetical protein